MKELRRYEGFPFIVDYISGYHPQFPKVSKELFEECKQIYEECFVPEHPGPEEFTEKPCEFKENRAVYEKEI